MINVHCYVDNKCIFLEGSKSDLVCGEDNITYSTMCHLVKNGTQYGKD